MSEKEYVIKQAELENWIARLLYGEKPNITVLIEAGKKVKGFLKSQTPIPETKDMSKIYLPKPMPEPVPFDAGEKITNSSRLVLKPYQEIKMDFGKYIIEAKAKETTCEIYQITEFKHPPGSHYNMPAETRYVFQVEMETEQFKLTDTEPEEGKNGNKR